jgi:arylsulfatase A-like enzyme
MLSACGGGSGGSSTSTPTPPTPPASTNTAPIVASANNDQSATAGVNFTYDATQNGATFSDTDGDALSYSVAYSPESNGLTDENGVISGAASQTGTYTITITADDGNGGQASDSFDITVNAAPTSNNKPNILFVITDDQGKDASAEYSLSTDLPNTPNFSARANDGLIFENLWVSPTCSPTRAALISGKYGHRTNVLSPGDALPASEAILQSVLKSDPNTSDYVSAIVGKWHLGGGRTGPGDFGVEHFVGILSGGVQDYFDWTLNINGTNSNSTNYVTTELTDQAIDWVSNQTQPWFLWLSYNAPHTPFHLPPTDLHDRNLSGTAADINANRRDYYLAAIEAMDTEFGRFWNSLAPEEQDNTYVIFIGDNGSPGQVIDRGIAQNGSKSSLFQGGVNTPMFVSGPGVTRRGEREDSLITHTDFFPTIVELAGGELSNYQDGQSFADILTSGAAPDRDYSYTNSLDGWTIRNATHKLITYTDGSQDLFDLINDPAEATDLLDGSSDTSAILSELTDEANRIRGAENITATKFTNLSPNCSDYVGEYQSRAEDIGQNVTFSGQVTITANSAQCTISSNSIPNHDFNEGARGFPNNVGEVNESFSFTTSPSPAANTTPLTIDRDNAILLNGVKVDVLAAACFGVGDERTGCGDPDQPWRFDPMHGPNGFNVDMNNAHAQPDGAYHYHGPPPIFNGDSQTASGVIGFAADGYPIFGPYFDAGGTFRPATSSYRLKSGDRPSGAGDPGGSYDGTYRDDYEYVAGQGDLDECNGMSVNGQYGYYVTTEFPYLVGCYTGTPDASFLKR